MTFTGKNWVDEIPFEKGGMIGPISDRYGVVYSAGFHTEFFFERDPNIEKRETPKEKKRVEKLTVEDMLRKEGFSETDANAEQRMKDQAYLYSILVQPAFRKRIEDDFGIELRDFSVREQMQFLNFLFEKNEEEVKRVIKFIGSKYRPHSFFLLEEDRKKKENYEKVDPENFFDPAVSKNRLKSFLSLEQGGADMGEKILTIGEKLPKEVADTVFGKYAEMADSIGSLESSLREYYDGEKKDEYVRSIGERILVRAKDMLIRFSDLEMDVDYLLKMLDRERASVAVFLATCKILRKEKKMPSLEELPSVNFRAMTSRELSLEPELVHEMRSIYEENYAAYPKEFREKIVGSLQERISKNSVFYLLKKDDQLLAFNAFTRNDDGTLSFGSFNILPEAQGNALAEAMIESTVLKHGEEWKLVAECDARKPISKKYIEYGFFVKRMYSAHFSDGDVPVLVIERNPHGLHSRKHEEVGEVKELAVPLVKLEETLTPLLAEGFVVTRYENQNLENILCSLERP